MTNSMHVQVYNINTGEILGVYQGATRAEVLDAMAVDHGFDDYNAVIIGYGVTSSPLNGGDSHCRRATFRPDPENIPSRVHVAIMRRATTRTVPVPNSKTCDTFRASDHTAVGTGLGSPSFIGFDVTCPVPAGLVAEHVAEHRPASVEHGFCHSRLCKLGRIHIADDDQLVFTSDLSAHLVELILACIGNLGVDRFDAPLVAGALSNGKRAFVATIVLQGWDRLAITTSRKCLEAKINADLTVARPKIVGDFTLKRDIPASAGVLCKASRSELTLDLARLPEAEFSLEVDDVRVLYLQCAWDKRNPSERAFGAATGPKVRGVARGIARDYKLFAYLVDRIGVQSEVCGAASGEFTEIEMRRPSSFWSASPVVAFDLALDFAAIVPDEIDRARMPIEMLPDCCVLDAEFECENHQVGRSSGASDWRSRARRALVALGGLAFCSMHHLRIQQGG